MLLRVPKPPNLVARVKENLRRLKDGSRGSRFLDCFNYKQELRREHGSIHRKVDLMLGYGLVFFGLIMVPAPGPGWIIVALGAALLAGESQRMAKALDRFEIVGWQFLSYLRRSWRQASLAVKSLVTLLAGSLAAGVGYVGYIIVQGLIG